MKSWRTTVCGIGCWLCAFQQVWEDVSHHDYNLHRLGETMHFWAVPIGLFFLGLGLIHARDHKAK